MDQELSKIKSLFLFSLTRAWCAGVHCVAIVTAPVRVAAAAGGGVCVAQLLPHGHFASQHSDSSLL